MLLAPNIKEMAQQIKRGEAAGEMLLRNCSIAYRGYSNGIFDS